MAYAFRPPTLKVIILSTKTAEMEGNQFEQKPVYKGLVAIGFADIADRYVQLVVCGLGCHN